MSLQKAKITGKKILTYDVFELDVRAGDDFEFLAGQFITIKIDDNGGVPCFRAYSIASAPRNHGSFELCIKVIEGGRGSNWLNNLKVGDEIRFMGPNGEFKFESSDKKALFIATGTGIAPFKSIIEQELEKGNKQKIELIFGLRYEKDLIYQEFFEKSAEKHENFKFKLTLSRPENKGWQGRTGRVTNILDSLKIDIEQTEVYICGLKAMIESVEEILKKKGVPEEAVHTEKYN